MRVSIGDVRLFFDIDGEALRPDGPLMRQVPTLLLLHGGPLTDHSMFKPQYAQLRDVAQLVYLDHRGCGRSDPSTSDHWNLSQWAADVRAFCDALEIQNPIVLGVSFGGIVAMKYSAAFPDHPSRLILVSTVAKWRFDRMLAAFERLGGLEARRAAQRFWEDPTPQNRSDYSLICGPLLLAITQRRPLNLSVEEATELVNSNKRWATNRTLSDFFIAGENRTFDLLPDLRQIDCPTLVLAGDMDPLTTPADSEDIVSALPKGLAQYERFLGAGHGIVHDSREPFFAAVRRFIAS
jgi:pimeloyl-ACP methyl ester carboxylesterase